MTAQATIKTVEPRFINLQDFPQVLLDNRGGKETIKPGQVVTGQKYLGMSKTKKGLTRYTGERKDGIMQDISEISPIAAPRNLATRNQQNKHQQNIHKAGADGKVNTTINSDRSIATGEYQGKTIQQWAELGRNGIERENRGTLVGLGNFIGLKFKDTMPKKDIVPHIVSTLDQYKIPQE